MAYSAEDLLRRIEVAAKLFERLYDAGDEIDRAAVEYTYYRVMGAALGDEAEAAVVWLRFATGTTRN